VFSDSDVYKLIEAMAWEVARTGDSGMEGRLNSLVERIARAQEPDGYLNTSFGRPGQSERYSDLRWGHELYCFGHLIQAAIARARTHGEDQLFRIARRAADHVCAEFGAGGNQGVCGHPEIELALVELYRYTGDPSYLAQAQLFIDRRGYGVLGDTQFGRAYFQDDVPVRETKVMSGHAVRALYLAAGAVDVATETRDTDLLDALRGQVWETLARRTYLTGGMGAHHEGESFGLDYELPSDRAYSETCAAVGSIMVNYRLLLQTGSVEYADAIERTLYNVIATSPSVDGESFFYTNTLHQRIPGAPPSLDEPNPRAASSLRAPWFEVSCCPTNVARTLASLSGLIATSDGDGLQLFQYANCEVRSAAADGSPLAIRVTTAYPDDGEVILDIVETRDEPWTLSIRIPSWASDTTVWTRGDVQTVQPGLFSIRQSFSSGERIRVSLPMHARWTWPDPRIDDLRGQVAVERGPLVMCVESVDLPVDVDVNELRVHPDDGIAESSGSLSVRVSALTGREAAWPYGDRSQSDGTFAETAVGADEIRPVTLIPYHRWANRGPSTMRVWMPVARGDQRRVGGERS
jgi:DUF1680 family protein